MIDFLKTYRHALYFLGIFLGLYLLLNTFYGFFIEAHYPAADPLTTTIALQVKSILSWFYPNIRYEFMAESASITILYEGGKVINIFEGCNGLNVMIVFLAFVLAFSGRVKSTLFFLAIGLTLLYGINLMRVTLLFQVALHFPDHLYFFHKYFFTGVLYVVVFALWYLWVQRVKQEKSRSHAA